VDPHFDVPVTKKPTEYGIRKGAVEFWAAR
jgi:hypothetical protein